MGEFWYGKSPETAVRTHGHFYPSCTSKCGPLLGFMLKGLRIHKEGPQEDQSPSIIHDDESLIVVEKPAGMPSVPGLDGRQSLQEWLGERYEEIHAVHRLDMDTSGVMLFAKTQAAAIDLRRQFEEHSVCKTYRARLSACKSTLSKGNMGIIELSLSPDYDERPRQKVDPKHGKPAVTGYEVIEINEDGTIEISFHPVTGRTHQLRVHSAHTLGLGCPIVGDMLYGGDISTRLHLHAYEIQFRHPSDGKSVCFTGNSRMF
jgi:tRNA pseudouridine32 synthase/23S rRNA pseudouridine746 synthase